MSTHCGMAVRSDIREISCQHIDCVNYALKMMVLNRSLLICLSIKFISIEKFKTQLSSCQEAVLSLTQMKYSAKQADGPSKVQKNGRFFRIQTHFSITKDNRNLQIHQSSDQSCLFSLSKNNLVNANRFYPDLGELT